jgi:hypothetical protein
MHLYEQGRPHLCPSCGRKVRRVHRTDDDMESRFAESMARYRCVSEACGWNDLLPMRLPVPTARPSPRIGRLGGPPMDLSAARNAGRRLVRAWPLLLAGIATAAIVSQTWTGTAAAPRDVRNTLPLKLGEHHDGVDITADHPLLKAAQDPVTSAGVQRLSLKQGCAWGMPGRNPYRGSVEQALVTAKLPPEVIQRIASKVSAGQLDDRLEITNAGIRPERDEQREFDSRNVAMTYGHTLCVNTRVNFQRGHVERASLFEASDKQGNLYSVMVPDVCGNVSVLGARMERKRKRIPLAVLAETLHGAPALMRLVTGAEDREVRTVPEPGSLALALGALGLMAGLARLRQSRARARGANPR